MSKSDLQARPIYHRKRDSIEAHLTIVFAALAVSRWIEARTGWSIRKFVKTARRYRTIEIQAGRQTITAADPLPDDLRQALDAINRAKLTCALGWPNSGYKTFAAAKADLGSREDPQLSLGMRRPHVGHDLAPACRRTRQSARP